MFIGLNKTTQKKHGCHKRKIAWERIKRCSQTNVFSVDDGNATALKYFDL
jgi:hypothetical protein